MVIKDLCKNFIYKIMKASKEKIQAEIDKACYISFDVFDTLIKRNVTSPEEVFTYLERQLMSEGTLCFEDFARIRMEAERRAREGKSGREVTLAEIYALMPVEQEQRESLMQMECRAEINVSTVNLEIKPFYDLCIERGKTILFISDMYLPMEVLEEILHKNGYIRGKLYVSSESGLTKRSGKLFEYVQEKEQISFKNWVHVGDSIKGDYLIPKRLGIRTCLIERNPFINQYINRKLYRVNLNYRRMEHFIDTRIGRYTNSYERIGYAVLGPILYGFSVWLEREIPKDETIVFLAREGALLKRAFSIVSNRPSVYLRVSRHALNSVRIDHTAGVDDLLNSDIILVNRYSNQSTWATMCGLTGDDIIRIFHREGLDQDVIVGNEDMKRRLLTAIWSTAKSNAKGQYELFRAYLKQLRISRQCAIVDVGWTGTMQALLSSIGLEINKKPIRWDGYYLGISKMGTELPYSKFSKKAFLFNGKEETHIKESIDNSHAFFETLFLSIDGTTKRYALTGKGVHPMLGEAENDNDISRIICAIQKAGIAFLEDVIMSKTCIEEVNSETAIANYEALARIPSNATLRLFRNFMFFEEQKTNLVDGKPLLISILHPKQLIYDFARSGNKSWFLKNVFRLPLPYSAMIRFAKRLVDKKCRGIL